MTPEQRRVSLNQYVQFYTDFQFERYYQLTPEAFDELRHTVDQEAAIRAHQAVPSDHPDPDSAWSDLYHRERAKGWGLPETTTEEELHFVQDEMERAILTKALGWSDPAADPRRYEMMKLGLRKSIYPEWRTILIEVLGLSATATLAEMVVRIRQLHPQHIEEDG
jgi:hypothetical protein